MPELPNNKPHQLPKQSHTKDHTEQIEATSGEDHCQRTGKLQSRQEYHRADLQPMHYMWEMSQAPARPLPCLHRLQEGLQKGLACSFVGNHEEVQHISTNLIQVIKNLYNKATSAVLFNSSIGDCIQTTVGVWQGCLLSPTLVNIFLERISTETLEDHEGTVSIGGRTNTNLRFAGDIDGLAGEEEELAELAERLNKASTFYGMEISAKKIKLKNNTGGINNEI